MPLIISALVHSVACGSGHATSFNFHFIAGERAAGGGGGSLLYDEGIVIVISTKIETKT
jgi:hypothetical protein